MSYGDWKTDEEFEELYPLEDQSGRQYCHLCGARTINDDTCSECLAKVKSHTG